MPGTGQSDEEQNARPLPDVELADSNLGQLLEVGSRGRPWLAPLSLTGLGVLGLLSEGAGNE